MSKSGNIDPRVKFIAIPILLITAFLLGALVIGPWWKSHTGAQTDVAQSPMPSSPRSLPSTSDKQSIPKVEMEVTENKPTPPADKTNAADANGVKKDGNSITVTMDPNSGDKQPEVQTPEQTTDAETPVEEAPQVKKHTAPAVNTDNTSAEKSRTAVSAPSNKSSYRVQAGTYTNKASADRLSSDLADHGYRAEVKTVQVEARTLYRVQIGEYKSKTNADEVASKLKDDGYSPTVVRVE